MSYGVKTPYICLGTHELFPRAETAFPTAVGNGQGGQTCMLRNVANHSLISVWVSQHRYLQRDGEHNTGAVEASKLIHMLRHTPSKANKPTLFTISSRAVDPRVAQLPDAYFRITLGLLSTATDITLRTKGWDRLTHSEKNVLHTLIHSFTHPHAQTELCAGFSSTAHFSSCSNAVWQKHSDVHLNVTYAHTYTTLCFILGLGWWWQSNRIVRSSENCHTEWFEKINWRNHFLITYLQLHGGTIPLFHVRYRYSNLGLSSSFHQLSCNIIHFSGCLFQKWPLLPLLCTI